LIILVSALICIEEIFYHWLLLWQCRAAGMDDYLSKPINRDLLYSTIEKWLEAAQHADAAVSRIFCNN
jgi:CheY-like chemotaxis protein